MIWGDSLLLSQQHAVLQATSDLQAPASACTSAVLGTAGAAGRPLPGISNFAAVILLNFLPTLLLLLLSNVLL